MMTSLPTREQKQATARARGGQASARTLEPVEWDPDRAIEGLKRILREVYS